MLVASQVAPGKPQILHHPHLSDDVRQNLHGVGRHTMLEHVEVDQPVQVEFEFTIGEQPVRDGGELLVVWRWPFDFSELQDKEPRSDGFMTVRLWGSDGRDVSHLDIRLRYNWIAGIEPWHHQLQIKVSGGDLIKGDAVKVTCGDQSQGSAGWRVPTCAAERCQFLMLIDHDGNGTRNRLLQLQSTGLVSEESTFRISPAKAHRLVAIAESDAVVNEPVLLIIRADDQWGNPTALPDAESVEVTAGGCSAEVIRVERLDRRTMRPAVHVEVTLTQPGEVTFDIACGEFRAKTNPIMIHETPPELSLFWGDLHSGQTEIGCGNGSLAEHYAFGRDCSGLQFITHQANDHYCTVADWIHTRKVTEEFHQPNKFIPVLGCEWSPLTKDGGDRNVFYRTDEPKLRRSDRFFREAEPDPTPDVRTAPEFHEAFHDLDVLVNIHVGGRMTNLQWYDQKIERLCETHSTHGTVEWFFMDALERGYKVGLTAGTDGVMGRPGACLPGRRLIRNCSNGLTAVYATELTRESIWQALKERRCYATSGERIRLWFEVNNQPMGSELATDSDSLSIQFDAVGTQPIERVDLFEGSRIVKTFYPSRAKRLSDEETLQGGNDREVRILWGGTERRGTARLQKADWTGTVIVDQAAGTEPRDLPRVDIVETINFQSVDDWAVRESDSQVSWSNFTAGNMAGVTVRLLDQNAESLTVRIGGFTKQFSLKQILSDTQRCEMGGVNKFISVGPPPSKTGALKIRESIEIPRPNQACPVWIRVTQIDQAQAWSSPVYLV